MTGQYEQEHMPLVQLAVPGQYNGGHAYCDYCPADAVYYHWASKFSVDREAYACAEHVRYLNRYYAVS